MKEISKEIRRQWITTIIFIAIILALAIAKGRSASGRITVQVSEDAIGIAGEMKETIFVLLSDIESVELVNLEEFDPGIKKNGEDTANLYEGLFDNEKYGEYTAVIGSDSKQLIVVKSHERTIVFTGLSNTDTAQIYEKITNKLS